MIHCLPDDEITSVVLSPVPCSAQTCFQIFIGHVRAQATRIHNIHLFQGLADFPPTYSVAAKGRDERKLKWHAIWKYWGGEVAENGKGGERGV